MLYALMLAVDEPAKSGQDNTGAPGGLLLYMAVIFALFYFIILRPQRRRQEQERSSLLTSLKKNDRVLTVAGIYGTVVAVSENEDEVTVKVDDNVRVRMTKASIARNLSAEEAAKEAKAAK